MGRYVRILNSREYIRNTLEEGTHIVCDRYCFSGVAYSAAKVGGGCIVRGLIENGVRTQIAAYYCLIS